MNSKVETIAKLSSALKVDSVKDVKYIGKYYYPSKCVCGQPIKWVYVFANRRNGLQCAVGKECLPYIFDYIKI